MSLVCQVKIMVCDDLVMLLLYVRSGSSCVSCMSGEGPVVCLLYVR